MVDYYKTKDYMKPGGFPITIFSQTPQPECPPHRHQFSELVVITGGSGVHVVQDETYPIATGDIYVIKDHTWHEYRDVQNLHLVNILYDPHGLKMSRWDVRSLPGYHAMFKLEPAYRKQHKFQSRLRLSVEDLGYIKEQINRLDQELTKKDAGYRLMATGIFMEIVAFLSRHYGKSRKPASRALLRIGQAISYIEDHYEEEVHLDTLAAIAHMSRRHFQRVFREAMDQSVIDYLIHVRVARARDLLRNPELSITEIAFKVGFSDSNYFSRQFKKILGVAPRHFRT